MKPKETFRRQIGYLVGASALICFAGNSMAQSAPASMPASASAASTGLYCDDPAHAGMRCCELAPAEREKDSLCLLIPNISPHTKVAQNLGGASIAPSLLPTGALNGIVVSPAGGRVNLESLAPGGPKE
ncbi:hypothetical protein SD235_11655 [Burkholderia cepacia]|uniref:hypothetical protein n=1 Tax=Burkholderia cepacia TaxID=292 RepID=UPI003A4D6C6E